MNQKPELLMPAGNTESFFAAIEGGADAVYLGLKQFNARERAYNFSVQQLQSIVKTAHEKGVKVYLTLNTVVKNSELKEMAEMLYSVSQTEVDAIIIQDWGVYFLAKKYFPRLPLHASTQMGNHNSMGLIFSQQKGFKRVVLARELTQPELKTIIGQSNIQTEIFIHGALCYSFSGMCLFSSFIGGRGANRGMCAQPCRHNYTSGKETNYLFSLNDNQQLHNLEKFKEWGVNSLKIEGRMKSAEYVYRVAQAYRLALDFPHQITEAAKLLEYDFGRPKTEYFFGRNLAQALSNEFATGKIIGMVEKVEKSFFYIKTDFELEQGYRIRVQSPVSDRRVNIKISGFRLENGLIRLKIEKETPQVGDVVFLTGMSDKKFPSDLKELAIPLNQSDINFLQKIQASVKFQNNHSGKEEVYLRINSTTWLKHIRINDLDGLFLAFPKKTWSDFKADAPFIQENIEKIFVELPKFISEKSISFYRELMENLHQNGIRGCVISHLSQKLIVPEGWRIIANENVYAFNDAAAKAIRDEGVTNVVFPFENDFENLKTGTFRDGIVPMYFYPELFYSRMPVRVGEDGFFQNEGNKKFRQLKKDGMTIVIPTQPVSFLQYKNQLSNEGFHRFLIDVSYDNPSKNVFKKLIGRFRTSEQVQPSSGFNFKMGMR